jgi:hypothetical protein
MQCSLHPKPQLELAAERVPLRATDESQVGLCNGDSGAIIGVGASD